MEDDAEELIDTIRAELNKFNPQIADAVYDYYTSQEYNNSFMIQTELEDKKQAYILQYISTKFQLASYQIDFIYNTLYFGAFGVKPSDVDDVKASAVDDNKKKNTKLPSAGFKGIPSPKDINWNEVTVQDLKKFDKYLAVQYPRLHQNSKFSDAGKSILYIFSIGHYYNINLISLLFDIFCEYRINLYNDNNPQWISFDLFLNKMNYFRNLKQSNFLQYNYIRDGLSYYIRKFSHILHFQPLALINDSYYSFVKYTFSLTQSIKKLQNVFINKTGCPFQIDLWIIPHHCISVPNYNDDNMDMDDMFQYAQDDDDDDDINAFANMIDSDDDNDDNNDDYFADDLNAPSSDDSDPQIQKIDDRLNSILPQINYIKDVINHSDYINNIRSKILNGIKFICHNKYRNKRVIIIIDRRSSSSKLNNASDVLYIYQPPSPYGMISKDYCQQNMFNLSYSYLLPKLQNEQRVMHISCNDNLKGRMFCLSFHINSWNKIRLYWYNQSGVCTRFRKQYLYTLWPNFFFKDINRNDFKRVDKKLVDQQFKIPLNDDIFDNWYKNITGKPVAKR